MNPNWIGVVAVACSLTAFALAFAFFFKGGAAALLRHFGIEATERELSLESYTYRGGTEAW